MPIKKNCNTSACIKVTESLRLPGNLYGVSTTSLVVSAISGFGGLPVVFPTNVLINYGYLSWEESNTVISSTQFVQSAIHSKIGALTGNWNKTHTTVWTHSGGVGAWNAAGGSGSGDITGVTLAGDSGTAEDLTANVDLTIAGGNGITTAGSVATMTIALDADLTTVTSLFATDIKIGEDYDTKIDFETADEIHFDTAGYERMQIDADGKVGIGTTLPVGKLEIAQAGLAVDDFYAGLVISDDTGAIPSIQLRDSASPYYLASIQSTAGGLEFWAESDYRSAVYYGQKMTITNTGKVGINMSDPTETLTVSGAGTGAANISARDVIYARDGNSDEWVSTHTDVYANSGDWEKTHSTLYANSAVWQQNRLDLTEVISTSSDWNKAKTTVFVNSGKWEINPTDGITIDLSSGIITITMVDNTQYSVDTTGRYSLVGHTHPGIEADLTDVWANSSNWISTNTDVYANSGDWTSTHTDVYANSSNWVDTHLTVYEISGMWEENRLDLSEVALASATWNAGFTPVDLTDVWANSSNWISTNTDVYANSSNWVDTHLTVYANSGTGTTNTIAKWTSDVKVGDSIITDIEYDGEPIVAITGSLTAHQLSSFGITLSGVDRFARISANRDLIVELDTDVTGGGTFILSADNADLNGSAVLKFGPNCVLSIGQADSYIKNTNLVFPTVLAIGGHTSASGTIFTSGGELAPYLAFTELAVASSDWSSTHTDVYANSAVWQQNRLDLTEVISTSGEWNTTRATQITGVGFWDDVVTTVKSNSGSWDAGGGGGGGGDKLTYVSAKSGDWNSTHTDVYINSGDWQKTHTTLYATSSDWVDTHLTVYATSSDWVDTHLSVYATSANWQSVVTDVFTNSGDWTSTHTDVYINSGDWQKTHTTLYATSSDWVDTHLTVYETSAAWHASFLSFDINSGKLTLEFADASTITVDLDDRYAIGQGTLNYVPLWVDTDTIADSNIYVFGSSVGINEDEPTHGLTVGGDLSARHHMYTGADLFTSGSNSERWSSVWTVVNANSGGVGPWNTGGGGGGGGMDSWVIEDEASVFTSIFDGDIVLFRTGEGVELDLDLTGTTTVTISAPFWTTVNTNSSNWTSTHTDVYTNSGDWTSTHTDVYINSGDWQKTHSTLYANSADWENNFTTLNTNSGDWTSTHTDVYANSAVWQQNRLDLTTIIAASADWENNFTTLNTNSGVWQQNRQDLTTIIAASSDWNNAWTTLNTFSGIIGENRQDIANITGVSAHWNIASTHVTENSGIWYRNQTHLSTINTLTGLWNNSRTHLYGASSNWQNTYSHVYANSAKWDGGGNTNTTVNAFSALWLHPLSAKSIGSTFTSVSTISAYRAVYRATDGTYQLACANTAVSADVVGITTLGNAVAGQFDMIHSGITNSNLVHGFTVGEGIFLADDVGFPGVMTTTEPTAAGSISKPIGVSISTTQLMIQPLRGIEISSSTISEAAGWVDDGTVIYSLANRNVGIGESDPGEKLTVAGSISAQGDLYVSESSIIYAGSAAGIYSARWAAADVSSVKSTSGNWNQVYTTVQNESGAWVGAGGGGDITEVVAGDGLTGGATSGIATVNAPFWSTVHSNSGADGPWAQPVFKTISVTSEDDVVADSTTDTLTLSAGDNISINTYASLDTITFNSTYTDTTYTAGDALVLDGTEFKLDDPANGTTIDEGTIVATDRMLIWDEDGDVWKYVTIEDLQDEIDTGGGGGGSQNIFETISVAGQTDIVAGSTTGTLSAMAGDNITITTRAGTDTIIFAATDTNTTYTAGDLLDLSTTTFNVDLTEAAAATIAAGDYVLFLDGGTTGTQSKGSIHDVASLFAGTGLTASSSVIGVDASQTQVTGLGTVTTGTWSTGAVLAGATMTLGSDAEGDIYYRNSSGVLTRLAKGTDNHVLTMNGDVPNWEAAAGGGSGDVVDDTTPQLGGFLDPNSKYIGMAKGGNIASASPLVIDTDGDYFDVTGTTGFAAMTVAANRHFFIQFDDALAMTHHATNLDLPGEGNITTAAGDVAEFFSTGTNTVQCVNYTKADGTAVVASGVPAGTTRITSGTTYTVGTGSTDQYFEFNFALAGDHIVVTLPVAATAGAGREYIFMLDTNSWGEGSYDVRVEPEGSSKIQGSGYESGSYMYTSASFYVLVLICTGTDWLITSNEGPGWTMN